MGKKDEKALATQPTGGLPAELMDAFGSDAGGGFENASQSSYAIPFLKLLAAMSKQCKRGTAEYIKGAEEGMFYNSVTGEVFDGEVGLDIVPVHFMPKFIEYEGTVDEGGGFVRTLTGAEGNRLLSTCSRDSDGYERLPRGADGKEHILVDVREHYVLVIHPETRAIEPCVLGLTSSGISVSKQWMSKMAQFKRKPTQPGPDAMFSHLFHLTSFMKQSKKVDTMYATYRVEHKGGLESCGLDGDFATQLYVSAKQFKEQISAGAIQAPDYSSERSGNDEDPPF
jgi:hypothetical protein